MGNKDYDIIMNAGSVQNQIENRRVKKFFRFAAPILIIEIIVALALGTYLLIISKNYCTISINVPNAVIYVNDEVDNKFRMEKPNQKSEFYFYGVDVSILLPDENATYNVDFVVKCDKYDAFLSTTATLCNKTYSMQIHGGEKTQLFSALTIKSSKKIKNYKVSVEVIATKI